MNVYTVKFHHYMTEEIEAFIESEHDVETAEILFAEKLDATIGPESYDIEFFRETTDEEKEKAAQAKEEWDKLKQEHSAYADNKDKTVH